MFIPEEIKRHIKTFLPYRPKTKDELQTAIYEYFTFWPYSRGAVEKYGKIETWDTSCIEDMSELFKEMYYLEACAIENWDVSNVTNFRNMFEGCLNFDIDIGNWDVGSGEDFTGMFKNCKRFEQNISDWNVENGLYFDYMFYGSRFNKNISKWKPKRAISMTYMFAYSKFAKNVNEWEPYVDLNIPMTNIFLESGMN